MISGWENKKKTFLDRKQFVANEMRVLVLHKALQKQPVVEYT